MELKVENYQLPETISFNFEELKAELEARVHMYEVMFYADDQIREAKADRASLNKLKKALNDERIRREREYMVPFNDFKARINEIIGIIDKPVEMIDKQVKAYEDKQKQDKLDAIITFFNEQNHPEWLHFSQIFDERWLNASVSMKSVQDAISAELVRINTDLTTLHSLPEFGFEATEVYKSTLDINKAISEGHRLLEIAQKKAEFESTQAAKLAEQMAEVEVAKVVEEVLPEIEPVHTWIAFEANMTIDDAIALREFFNSRHIEFRALYA